MFRSLSVPEPVLSNSTYFFVVGIDGFVLLLVYLDLRVVNNSCRLALPKLSPIMVWVLSPFFPALSAIVLLWFQQ